jgi:hypothetical protein
MAQQDDRPALAEVRAARADLDAALAALASKAVAAVGAREPVGQVAVAAGRSREWVRLELAKAADARMSTQAPPPIDVDGE